MAGPEGVEPLARLDLAVFVIGQLLGVVEARFAGHAPDERQPLVPACRCAFGETEKMRKFFPATFYMSFRDLGLDQRRRSHLILARRG